MAAQADGLLVHRGLVRVDRRLGQDAGLVDAGVRQHLLHAREQLFAVLPDALGRTRFHLAHHALDRGAAAADIVRELFALAQTHLVKAVAGLLEHRGHVADHLVRVLLDALRAQHVRHLGQHRDSHIVPQAVGLAQVVQRVQIALCQRMVDRDGNIAALLGLHADEDLHLAARDARRRGLFDRIIQKTILARRLDRAVQIAVVDRAQLDRDRAAVQLFLGAAVTGHTLHVVRSPFSVGRQASAQHCDQP